MVLPDRCNPAHPLLLPRPSPSSLVLALRQCPDYIHLALLRPTCQRRKLYVVGAGGFRLPVVHEALPLPLVDAIQLSHRGGTRCGGHFRRHYHLHYRATAQRRFQRQLVGQRCVEEYCGREYGAFEDAQ